jgi:hypothetical protein
MAKTVDGKLVKTGGRTKGTPNKKTVILKAAMQEAARQLGATMPDEYDAYTLLRAAYQNPSFPIRTRFYAAAAAIRFEKRPLAAVDATIVADIGQSLAIPVAARDPIEASASPAAWR